MSKLKIGRGGNKPDFERILLRAKAARDERRLDDAERLFSLAVNAAPRSGEARRQRGIFLYQVGRLAEAEAEFQAALSLLDETPSARRGVAYALGMTLLAQGRYGEGWAGFEHRDVQYPRLAEYRTSTIPEWQGGDLRGRKLLILREQGLGDQIMFARFAPILRELGALVTLVCDAPLVPLFGELGATVVAPEAGASVSCHTWASCMSLAHRLGATPETLPASPYLRATARWPGHLPDGFKVGLKALGNPNHQQDQNRCFPPELIVRHAPPGVSFVSLEPEDSGAADFAQTASLIGALDLVITCDTSVAHLAGAMGKPVWILLPAMHTDWRWMRQRADSPWYPSARLFRQSVAGVWDDVAEAVGRDLSALAVR